MDCHNCLAADAATQIKAGCGHVTHVCGECRNEESSHIRHQPCLKCRGGWCREMEPDYHYNPGPGPNYYIDDLDPFDDWISPSRHVTDRWDDQRNPAYPLSCDVSDCYSEYDEQYDDDMF